MCQELLGTFVTSFHCPSRPWSLLMVLFQFVRRRHSKAESIAEGPMGEGDHGIWLIVDLMKLQPCSLHRWWYVGQWPVTQALSSSTYCVTVGQFPTFSKPPFVHLEMGIIVTSHADKPLAQRLARGDVQGMLAPVSAAPSEFGACEPLLSSGLFWKALGIWHHVSCLSQSPHFYKNFFFSKYP